MHTDVKEILLSEEQIAGKVRELGEKISADYAGGQILLAGVLKGSVVFLADLMRTISVPVEIDFLSVSSYGSGSASSGAIRIQKDLSVDVRGRDVLIVEDILDSGTTLAHLKELLSQRGPNSVRLVALLDKPTRRAVDIAADYAGFVIPDEFVVGYGLDYNEQYRNLPYVGALRESVYNPR